VSSAACQDVRYFSLGCILIGSNNCTAALQRKTNWTVGVPIHTRAWHTKKAFHTISMILAKFRKCALRSVTQQTVGRVPTTKWLLHCHCCLPCVTRSTNFTSTGLKQPHTRCFATTWTWKQISELRQKRYIQQRLAPCAYQIDGPRIAYLLGCQIKILIGRDKARKREKIQ
jgi:hypothetical protein